MAKVRDGSKETGPLEQISLFTDTAVESSLDETASRITLEQARAILQEYGLDVTPEKADAVLSWLRRLAILTLSKLLKK